MFFVFLNDVKESAIRCGYKKQQAEITGIKLLSRKEIRNEIEEIRKQLVLSDPQELAKLGLWKIAFGDVRNTVESVINSRKDDRELNLENADLFCVSEIKLGKNDVTEIKLFDKIKALEALAALTKNNEDKDVDKSFFEALENGSKGVFGLEQ